MSEILILYKKLDLTPFGRKQIPYCFTRDCICSLISDFVSCQSRIDGNSVGRPIHLKTGGNAASQ
jgi:hypothetical protein